MLQIHSTDSQVDCPVYVVLHPSAVDLDKKTSATICLMIKQHPEHAMYADIHSLSYSLSKNKHVSKFVLYLFYFFLTENALVSVTLLFLIKYQASDPWWCPLPLVVPVRLLIKKKKKNS